MMQNGKAAGLDAAKIARRIDMLPDVVFVSALDLDKTVPFQVANLRQLGLKP